MSFSLPGPLVLVGAGNMGGALLKGWLDRGLKPSDVFVQDPAPPPPMLEVLNKHGVWHGAAVPQLPAPPSVLLLAVKPQIMDAVVPTVAHLAKPGTVVLSVAAGRTIESLARGFAKGTAIVRSIPNTPASVGRGITVAVANVHVSPAQKSLCTDLLAAVGEVGWVDDEGLIDAATAVSGSGPAYVFLFAEYLAEAAIAVGLPPELAVRLARATVSGAGELLHQSELDAGQLRKNVTSPNGTTAAALAVLMADDGIGPILTRAVTAARDRGRELGRLG